MEIQGFQKLWSTSLKAPTKKKKQKWSMFMLQEFSSLPVCMISSLLTVDILTWCTPLRSKHWLVGQYWLVRAVRHSLVESWPRSISGESNMAMLFSLDKSFCETGILMSEFLLVSRPGWLLTPNRVSLYYCLLWYHRWPQIPINMAISIKYHWNNSFLSYQRFDITLIFGVNGLSDYRSF